jgi:hypothetical protein
VGALDGEADASELRAERAAELDRKLMKIKGQIRRRWLEMGRVLAEIQETLAYRDLGYSNFQQYAEERVGISARWANYLVCMVRKAKRFGINARSLEKLDISKCLEIMRLNDGQKAKELVGSTIKQNTSLRDIKRQVAVALGMADEGEPKTVRKVWYFSESQWSVINQAIRAVNLAAGTESETYAIEFLAADYLAGIGLDEME